jgi:Outer membrane lipoprotein-sorting protein
MTQEANGTFGKPNAASILNRMEQALEPKLPSVRVMTLTVKSARGSVVEWKLAQALADVDGTKWMLTVVLLPPSAKGVALLDENKPPSGAVEHIYLPAVQRVRQFTPLQAWEPFFGSDFSYQDFIFPRASDRVKLKGTETHDGAACYRLEEALSKNPYFSKVETWVAIDSGLPVERNYYDLQGKLYKAEHYENVMTIQNIPTITKVVMKNVQQGGSSEINVTSVKYDKEVPKKLFDPANLSKAADDQFWKSAM